MYPSLYNLLLTLVENYYKGEHNYHMEVYVSLLASYWSNFKHYAYPYYGTWLETIVTNLETYNLM